MTRPSRLDDPRPTTREIRVDLAERAYTVRVGVGLIDELGWIVRQRLPRAHQVFITSDAGLPPSVLERAHRSLTAEGFATAHAAIVPSEKSKSLSTLEQVLAALARARHERAQPIVALGGGIVGDLAGFAAAVYRRAVPVFQVPTTLLSMVDAAIGGKTGVNLDSSSPGEPENLKKNFIGAFHQPSGVIIDVGLLASLPDRTFRCGLAECVKHGMIAADWGDPGLLDWTESNLDAILSRRPATLAELVSRNVAIKARVVASDEREELSEGGRALLNLGHTFGHAIETLPSLSPDENPANAPLQHGEAVALGLVAACHASEDLSPGPAGTALRSRIVSIVSRIGLPTNVRNLPPTEDVLALMFHDKKVSSGRLRLVLPAGPARAAVLDDPPRETVARAIDALRAETVRAPI